MYARLDVDDENSKNPLFIRLLLNGLLKTRSYVPTSQLQEFLYDIRTADRCIIYILNSVIKRNGKLVFRGCLPHPYAKCLY